VEVRYKKSLKEQGILTEGEIDVIDSKIKNKISDAEEFALASNSPEPDTVLEYVY